MKAYACIILLLLLLPLNTVWAQENVELVQNESGKFEYQVVFDASGTPDELYDRALTWIALNYKSANDVIQLKDRENYRIITKGVFKTTNYTQPVYIHHTLQVEAREGRYRVTFGPFIYQGGATAPEIPFEGRVPRGKRMREKTAEMIQKALLSLQEIMQEEAEDDW